MILIAIIFIGINYGIYTYFVSKQMESVAAFKNDYITKEEKISEMEVKKALIAERKKEIEKLKKQTADFNKKAPVKVNTPELIYDFYIACKEYEVTGDSISFQLIEGDTENKSSQVDNYSVYTLTINLKVIGNKNNMEKFIKNLNDITTRKLNVKSITLASLVNEDKEKELIDKRTIDNETIESSNEVIGQNITDIFTKTSLQNEKSYNIQLLGSKIYADGAVKKDNPLDDLGDDNVNNHSNNQGGSDGLVIPNLENNTFLPDQISAEIIFYQYIEKTDNSKGVISKDYDFYDSKKEGFNSIADMFK